MVTYDPNLRLRLPTTNDHLDEIVLNETFRDWNDYITADFERRYRDRKGSPCGDKYQHSPDRELLELCREHADRYNKSLTADNVLILVHPFYLSLTHMPNLNQETEKEYQGYLNKLFNLLQSEFDRSKLGIIVFETAYHYAAATSLLLESGLADLAVFTQYDSGYFVRNSDLSYLEDKSFFFAGGYNGQCLASAIENVQAIDFRKKEGFSEVWAVRDLVLNNPCNHHLTPEIVYSVRSSKTLDLNQLIKKLNL